MRKPSPRCISAFFQQTETSTYLERCMYVVSTGRYTHGFWRSERSKHFSSKHFPFGDHFIDSHNFSLDVVFDIVERSLMLITFGT